MNGGNSAPTSTTDMQAAVTLFNEANQMPLGPQRDALFHQLIHEHAIGMDLIKGGGILPST